MTKRKPKRQRGGQPGNQNSRKHGFYSRILSEEDIIECQAAVREEGLESPVAIMRSRIIAVLRRDPGNTRVLREAVLELTKYYRSRNRLSDEETAVFRKVVRTLFAEYSERCLERAGTNQDCSDDNDETK